MSAPLSVRLESESGQTLVFVVLSLLVLVLVLGLVINVGSWTRGKRQAQAAADAAALAAVQRLPDEPGAEADAIDYAQRNWASVDVDVPPGELTDDTVTVLTSHDMPGFLAGVVDVTVRADATARVGVPAQIANLAPIALECDNPCDPWDIGESVPFTFYEDENNPGGVGELLFGPIELPGVNIVNFDFFLRCDPRTPNPSFCNPDEAILTPYPRFDRTADELKNGLDSAGTGTRLVAIYNQYDSEGFHVVGWAAVSFSPPTDNGAGSIKLTGTFESLLVAGTGRNALPPPEDAPDLNFGVRAVGLVD